MANDKSFRFFRSPPPQKTQSSSKITTIKFTYPSCFSFSCHYWVLQPDLVAITQLAQQRVLRCLLDRVLDLEFIFSKKRLSKRRKKRLVNRRNEANTSTKQVYQYKHDVVPMVWKTLYGTDSEQRFYYFKARVFHLKQQF